MKVKMGQVNIYLPFYLNPKGLPYIKILWHGSIIFHAFNWRENGGCIHLNSSDHTDSITKEVSKVVYQEKQVEEFVIYDDHPLSTEPLYKDMKGI